jgi:uncharacterized DUF497 family protein
LTKIKRRSIVEKETTDIEFEWDEKKNAGNIQKHGISFEEAAIIFFDPLHSEIYDRLHSSLFEDRWKAFGLAGPVLVMVSYAERNGRIRIISARKATSGEKEAYCGGR